MAEKKEARQKRKRNPITKQITKKEFHKILEKASQPIKKQDKDK